MTRIGWTKSLVAKQFCFKNEEIKEDGVSAELASRSGNVVTFQHCSGNINNFNVPVIC